MTHCVDYDVYLPTQAYSRRRGYGVQSRLFVCLFVRAVKRKRLELSTPNYVHMYSIAVAWHALTQGQRSKVKVTRLRKPHGC